MGGFNGNPYLVNNDRLYRVDPNNGSYTQVGGVVWQNTYAINAMGSYLYISENGGLYEVNPINGSYARLTGMFWTGTYDLFIGQNSRIHIQPIE